jgi:hypothetical protein
MAVEATSTPDPPESRALSASAAFSRELDVEEDAGVGSG